MDKRKLQHFIKASNEDFADAHEPVNDGVKKVPNADDIARQIGRSGENDSADITSQGEATIIEEQTDDEDAGTEMTEQVTTDTDANDIVEETETTETESPVEDEPELAHDDVKAVEVDEQVTAKEKESLEAFVPIIRRAELIGYTKRQTEELGKSIRTIRAKAGLKGPVTVSAESIHETIELADSHLVKLAKKRKYLSHRVSVENIAPVVAPQNEEPLAHDGAAPLSAAQGLAITEAELAPVVDTVIEQQAMQDIHNEIGQLQAAGVAVEQYLQLVRENKGRLSKQTAAIIHAGLEHIDNMCGLRKRSTGLENYDTTPRMAMESTDVDEKSLLDRAGEIGAKILKWLQELITKAGIAWDKFSAGISRVQGDMDKILEQIKSHRGATPEGRTLNISELTSPIMFLDGEFIGTTLTKEEELVTKELSRIVKTVRKRISDPIAATLKSGGVDEQTLDKIHDILDRYEIDEHRAQDIKLPGGFTFMAMESSFNIGLNANAENLGKGQKVVIDFGDTPKLKSELTKIHQFTQTLGNDEELRIFIDANKGVQRALVDLRKSAKGGGFDETIFQRIQNTAAHATEKFFSSERYFRVLSRLAQIQGGRVKVYSIILKHLLGADKVADTDADNL